MAGEPAIVIESPEEAEGPPINLDEAAPVEQQPQREPAAKAAPSEVPAKPSIEDELQQLKRDLITKDQARQADQQRIQAAERQTVEARTQAADGQYHMLRNAVQAREAEIDGITQNLQKAWETGDFAAAAKFQKEMGAKQSEKTQYDMWLNQMEEQRKAGPQQQQPAADPVEQYLSTIQSPRARDWLRSHPDCIQGGSLHNAAMRAHYDALDTGLSINSDEYFQHLETSTGYREAPQKVTQQAPPTKRQASVSAPPSRSTPGLNGQPRQTGPRVLTQREADTAKELGMTNEEYYEHREGAKADGNYHKPRGMDY